MRSSNPVLTREATFRPSGPSGLLSGQTLTIESVVNKSLALFAIMMVTATAGWLLNLPAGTALIISLVAFGVGMFAVFKKKVSPPLYMLYAGLQGFVIGMISRSYEFAYSGIVLQAVLGVALVFGTMLFLYRARIIRVTNRFARIVVAAGFAYVALLLVNLVAGFFIEGGLGLYDGGPFAIIAGIVGVTIGAFFYALDFRQVEDLIQRGAPDQEGWRAAFGLLLTTVWVYLELLKLIGNFRQ